MGGFIVQFIIIMPVASACPDQNPKETPKAMASRGGSRSSWPTDARWRGGMSTLCQWSRTPCPPPCAPCWPAGLFRFWRVLANKTRRCGFTTNSASWSRTHPRAPVLSCAVTLFRVGSDVIKTNRGFLPPTRSQPRLGLVVGGWMRWRRVGMAVSN